jgi:NAD(P)-dependent dehydrogenase (short-subunit alcohol dehydrogenase family)
MLQTWFITGSSRGLGRALARLALDAGHQVVATARRTETLASLVAEYGDRVLPLALDVTEPVQVDEALAAAVARFGHIDVLVNNAGFANVAPVETGSPEDFRKQFETNFWGVYNVSRAAVPLLRRRQSSLIIQMSSMGGRVGGSPGLGSYQAAKFAINGLSRVLRAELAPFGVQVLVVEPSGFRTDWAGTSMTVHDVPDGYTTTVGAMNDRLRLGPVASPGDPRRAAAILIEIAQRRDVPNNLSLGVVASEMTIAQDEQLLASDTRWAAVSRSADAAQPYPATFPPEYSHEIPEGNER